MLSVKLTHDHLSAIGALTPEGTLVMHFQDHSYKGPDVMRFLHLLLRKIPGKLLIMWDGATIHCCRVLKDVLAQGEPHASISNACLDMRRSSIRTYLDRRQEQPAGKPVQRGVRAL